MHYIKDFNDLKDGTLVIEDTYNEVYQFFRKDGKMFIQQVGWQIKTDKPINENPREIDFSPDCPYDQPWIAL